MISTVGSLDVEGINPWTRSTSRLIFQTWSWKNEAGFEVTSSLDGGHTGAYRILTKIRIENAAARERDGRKQSAEDRCDQQPGDRKFQLVTTRRRFYQYRLESSTHPPLFILLVPACSATRFLSSYAVAFGSEFHMLMDVLLNRSGIRIVYVLLLVPGPTGMALRELRKSMYTCTTHKWTSPALKLWNHSLLSQGCLFSFHPLLSKTIVIGLEYALLVLG
ncbi:hypothetical protein B0H13DRAFT_1868528 [Mycena leptocephala]|nr:hypothetical protein B0H13DRAFT_1868528 [Mycena leptocephala]